MVARMVLVLSALGAVLGSILGIIAGLTLSEGAREWIDSHPWHLGFTFGGVSSFLCLGVFFLMFRRWPRFRRYIEGSA